MLCLEQTEIKKISKTHSLPWKRVKQTQGTVDVHRRPPHILGGEGGLPGGGGLEAETGREKRGWSVGPHAGEGHAQRPRGEKEPAVSVRPRVVQRD